MFNIRAWSSCGEKVPIYTIFQNYYVQNSFGLQFTLRNSIKSAVSLQSLNGSLYRLMVLTFLKGSIEIPTTIFLLSCFFNFKSAFTNSLANKTFLSKHTFIDRQCAEKSYNHI